MIDPCGPSPIVNGLESTPKERGIRVVVTILSLALFIIGCIGAAGIFPSPTIGYAVVGISGGLCVIQLPLGYLKKCKFKCIWTTLCVTILITVGALGGAGILSGAQVGWGVIGTALGNYLVSFACTSCQRKVEMSGNSAK